MECVPQGSLISLRLSWTLYGSPTSTEMCDALGIDEMRLTFEDSSGFERQGYAPIPCDLGQVFYNRMPGRYVFAELAAMSSGSVRDSRWVTLIEIDTVATVDLVP